MAWFLLIGALLACGAEAYWLRVMFRRRDREVVDHRNAVRELTEQKKAAQAKVGELQSGAQTFETRVADLKNQLERKNTQQPKPGRARSWQEYTQRRAVEAAEEVA